MKGWGLVLIFIVIVQIPTVLSVLTINEIFAKPADGNEWLELYNNNGTENITEWNITDNLSTDTIQCCSFSLACNHSIAPFTYIVIVDQDSTATFRLEPNVYCVDDNSIGNGLGDTSDTITIAKRELFHSISYDDQNPITPNYTSERREDNSWAESLTPGGTPLLQNSVWNASTSYRNLQINEILVNPLGADDEHKPAGEWVELYNNGSKSIDLRSLYFLDSVGNKLPVTSTNIEPGLVLCPSCFAQVFRDSDNDFSLNNGADSITLFAHKNNRDIFIQDMSYARATEGVSWNRFTGGWYEASPTPQSPNIRAESCDYELQLTTNDVITSTAEFNMSIATIHNSGYTGNISVKGIINYENEKIVRTYSPWTNDKIAQKASKTYSPNLAQGVYTINFWIENLSCSDNNQKNNNITLPVVIKTSTASNAQTELTKFKVPSTAKKGQIITVELSVHKGSTKESLLKIWLEQQGKKISPISEVKLEQQNQDYSLKVPLVIPCDADELEGKINIEGIGVDEKEEIKIVGSTTTCKTTALEDTKTDSNKSNEVIEPIDIPATITPGENFIITARLNSEQENTYQLWAYLYRGSRCFSCNNNTYKPEENSIIINTKPNSAEIITIPLALDLLQTGDYKIKLKAVRDGRKTPFEITSDIKVVPPPLTSATTYPELVIKQQYGGEGFVMYETNSYKTRHFIPYFIAIALFFLCITFIFLKKE